MREVYRDLPHLFSALKMRHLTAVGLAIVGLILAVSAAIGYLNMPFDVGDAAAVEAALAGPDPGEDTTTTSTTTFTAITKAPALWSANDLALLAELDETSGPRPERLIIEDLGVDAPIGEYGVAADGQMDVPDNVTEVGWYKYGPSPGEPGSAVLAAHVDLGRSRRGLFFDLDKLDADALVTVAYDNGETRTFRVAARVTYLKDELPLDLIFSREGDPVLTLVTCGGGFSRSTGRYDSNVVVYAVPVNPVEPADPN